jgi:formylglycine-generating enzyme required for sulfatase activity
MKILNAENEPDPDLRRELEDRFFQEAQVTAQLGHPGVPPIHEMGLLPDGRPFYTMPKLPKRTLEDVFQRVAAASPGSDGEHWTRERCLELLVRVLETLAFAHSKGVVHRDVKPANVIVGDFGAVLVIDWGLARVVGGKSGPDSVWSDRLSELRAAFGDDLVLTSPKGTPGYMAPEQAGFDASRQDARTDVYAVGAMLYRLLAGTEPHKDSIREWRERQGSLEEFEALLDSPPTPLARLAPEAPPELVAIAERAMQPKAAARYPTANAMAEDLRRYLEVRPVLAYRTGPWVEFSKWVRRNRAVASLLGALAVGTIGASWGGFFLERERGLALVTARDRERNLTGAVLLDSVLERSQRAWEASSQLPSLEGIQRDAAFLLERAEDLPRRIAALERELEQSPVASVRDDLQVQIAELQRQAAGLPALGGALGHARSIEERVRTRQTHRPSEAEIQAAWDRALTALAADKRFEGASIIRQPDLMPLGPTEPAGLWAFLHLETADYSKPLVYERADQVGAASGLVLLLLPGGEVSLGAVPPTSREEVDLPHRDLYSATRDSEWAISGHGPIPRTVRLDPYYLGRFEVTRGQWKSVMGAERVSSPAPEGTDPRLQPAVMLGRQDALDFAGRLGLTLPTEAQWEAAYRAGTHTPTFVALAFVETEIGPDYDWRPLEKYANVLDAATLAAGVQGASRVEHPELYPSGEPDDGFVHAAPVGSFAPNPFGLFDMAGNVWEWCLGDYVPGWGNLRPGDGAHLAPGDPSLGVFRGGSWYAPAELARAAMRFDYQPSTGDRDVGFRVARQAVAAPR